MRQKSNDTFFGVGGGAISVFCAKGQLGMQYFLMAPGVYSSVIKHDIMQVSSDEPI